MTRSTQPGGMLADPTGSPPSWRPDPTGRFEFRWFNGRGYTADVASGGVRSIDPLAVPPPGARPPSLSRTMAVTSLVAGIVGLALSWMPFLVVLGVLAAFVAVGTGLVAMRRIGQGTAGGHRAALAGAATGIIALFASSIGLDNTRSVVNDIERYADTGAFTIDITDCRLDGTTAVATGTIVNDNPSLGRSYIVRVSFSEGRDELAVVRAELDDVAAGDTASFTVTSFVGAIDPSRLDCAIESVSGPLPFRLG
ncbi:MAG: DUF4190 domain-containing protein [Actinomycetota bacterium]